MDNTNNNQSSSSDINSSVENDSSDTNLNASQDTAGQPQQIYHAPNSGNKFGLFLSFNPPKLLGAAALLLIIVAIPLTVYISQKQQELRQRASVAVNLSITPTPWNCGNIKMPAVNNITKICVIFPNTCSVPIGWARHPEYTKEQRSKCAHLSPTPTLTPRVTLTPTLSPTPTLTPTTNPSATLTLTPTNNPSQTATLTPTTNPSITATLTPTGGVTNKAKLAFTLKLQAFGNGQPYDSSKQSQDEALSEKVPQTKTRTIKVEIFDIQNNKKPEVEGNVTYQSDTGLFTGTANVNNLATGDYYIKVKTDKYLRWFIGKDSSQTIIHLAAGDTPNQLPKTKLLIGDINGDNNLDLIDYQIWQACFKKTMDTPVPLKGITGNCSMTDLSDNNKLDDYGDMSDYRWLFENFQIQHGD